MVADGVRKRDAQKRAMTFPSFSIVIPTYQRRDVVCGAVAALSKLQYGGAIELIVVVDGSTDGTEEAVKPIATPFSLRVQSQSNSGAAAARNAGAKVARHEILLFLDDDMIARPDLLAQHARSYAAGADAVLGHMPLSPESPRNFLSQGVADWTNERRDRLAQSDTLSLFDLLTGQLSVRRTVFEACGGFDPRFTQGGSFGDEDLDFGCRLLEGGWRIVFNADAISEQRYVVSYEANLRQWRQAGRADVAFARKHPERARELFELHGAQYRFAQRFMVPSGRVPGFAVLAGQLASALARRNFKQPRLPAFTQWLFFLARDLLYWRGVQEAGGIPADNPILVLCYHAIADLSDDRILADYGMPKPLLVRQLDSLARRGCVFLSGEEFDRYRSGKAGVPRNAVLLTFDDCYVDLLAEGAPVLRARGVPAVAFAVTGLATHSNEWDQRLGTRALATLDSEGLAALQRSGFEIGAHSRTHPELPTLDKIALQDEVSGSAADFAGMNLPRPRFFAYPYGEHNNDVRQAVAGAGFSAGFSLIAGRFRRGMDSMAVPRIEILRRDAGWRFAFKTRFPRFASSLLRWQT
jgi:peptidoglycan/xylan/chitin deacetylase (PgdA/CDA1 family)/GT2 family glycosyltransferase